MGVKNDLIFSVWIDFHSIFGVGASRLTRFYSGDGY